MVEQTEPTLGVCAKCTLFFSFVMAVVVWLVVSDTAAPLPIGMPRRRHEWCSCGLPNVRASRRGGAAGRCSPRSTTQRPFETKFCSEAEWSRTPPQTPTPCST